jgi:UDP-2,3-diacylglucosamine pyrophosphatase LpxH
MKKLLLCLLFILNLAIAGAQKDFTFIFLPDLHLNNESGSRDNFEKVASQINALHPDFILTGGDMIYTAKSVNDEKAEALFSLMDIELKMFKSPVYLTMGNHETVGITKESGINSSNPMWGKRMYEKRYNERYYAFTFSGWKFFVLDGIEIREKEKDYTQGVDKEQLEWIQKELSTTDIKMPVVISMHTPLINPHAMTEPGINAVSANSGEVLKSFRNHNLRIVLMGHTHLYMNLYVDGIHYISGGSAGYSTDADPFDKGFACVRVRNNIEEIEFIKVAK